MKPGDVLENGYTVKTTFWSDFSIADGTLAPRLEVVNKFRDMHYIGLRPAKPADTNLKHKEFAIKDTYKRAFEEWKTNTEYLTELSLVLNWKCWEFYNAGCNVISNIYAKLWEECDAYCHAHLKGEDAKYYFRTTD